MPTARWLAAKYYGWVWADPVMGIVGAILVGRWSIGLLHTTGAVLLDHEGPDDIRESVRRRIEADDGNAVTDLHLWAVGPRIYSAIVAVVADEPQPPQHYKRLIPEGTGIVHLVVEVYARNAQHTA